MSCCKSLFFAMFACLMAASFASVCSAAVPILAPADPILAIDVDAAGSNSNYPLAENPFNVADDDTVTKYLNFGQKNTGFIVTPVFGTSQVRSMLFSTANDAEPRDPATWALYGTNEAILSGDNSDGSGETWTLIESGAVAMPVDRQTAGPLIPVNNLSMYSSYRLIFPTVKDPLAANSMQVSEVSFYESTDGSGSDILTFNDSFLAVQLPTPQSRYPAAESPADALDGDVNTKYLNFGKENSGFIVTPAVGSSTVTSFQITTANDSESRDPASWILYGTNQAISSTDNSLGDGESWTLIEQGDVALPAERLTLGPEVTITNTLAYSSYRMVFPTIKDAAAGDADSMQIAEIQFFGTVPLTPMADVNMDGVVNIFDINLVSSNWNQTGTPGTVTGDGNKDGIVNIFDINLISANWSPSPGGSAAVPEPATVVLLVSALAAMCVGSLLPRRGTRR